MASTLLKNQPATDFAQATADLYVPPRDLVAASLQIFAPAIRWRVL
jgi:hypothetical protein